MKMNMRLVDFWNLFEINVTATGPREVAAFYCGAKAAMLATDVDRDLERFFARNERLLEEVTQAVEAQTKTRAQYLADELLKQLADERSIRADRR